MNKSKGMEGNCNERINTIFEIYKRGKYQAEYYDIHYDESVFINNL